MPKGKSEINTAPYELTISEIEVNDSPVFFVSFVESGLFMPTSYTSHGEAQDGMVSYANERMVAIDAEYENRTDDNGEKVTKGRRKDSHLAEYQAMNGVVNLIGVNRQREVWIAEFLDANGLTMEQFQTMRMTPELVEETEPAAPRRRNRRPAPVAEGEELSTVVVE